MTLRHTPDTGHFYFYSASRQLSPRGGWCEKLQLYIVEIESGEENKKNYIRYSSAATSSLYSKQPPICNCIRFSCESHCDSFNKTDAFSLISLPHYPSLSSSRTVIARQFCTTSHDFINRHTTHCETNDRNTLNCENWPPIRYGDDFEAIILTLGKNFYRDRVCRSRIQTQLLLLSGRCLRLCSEWMNALALLRSRDSADTLALRPHFVL